MNGGLKGSSQPRMLDPQDVLLENGLSRGITERCNRLADFFARTAKESRGRPSPLPTERINSIRLHQDSELVFRVPRDREAQKKE
jgi:hypothetical protein